MDTNRRKAAKCYSFFTAMEVEWETISEGMITELGKEKANKIAWAFGLSANHVKDMFDLTLDEISEAQKPITYEHSTSA